MKPLPPFAIVDFKNKNSNCQHSSQNTQPTNFMEMANRNLQGCNMYKYTINFNFAEKKNQKKNLNESHDCNALIRFK